LGGFTHPFYSKLRNVSTNFLELESMGSLALGEGELGGQVLAEVLDLVDGLKNDLVGGLLESDLVLSKGLLLLLTLEESLLSGSLLGSLGASEVGIVQLSIDLYYSEPNP